MDKLSLDEEAVVFLEEIIALSPDNHLDANLCIKVLENLKKTYADDGARRACARACRALITKYNEKSNEFFDKIIDSYKTSYQKSEPKLDDLGRKKINPLKDTYSDHRLSLARILVECIPLATTKSINKLLPFFVPSAVLDRNTKVQETMLEAALVLVDEHGSKRTQYIMSSLQVFLNKQSKTTEDDNLRKQVIVILGRMGKHLSLDDPQLKNILANLIQALNTPSQVVQEAVANCFPPLIDAFRKESTNMLKELNKTLYESTDYGQRKGAAYGIAGIARGLGIQAIKQQTGYMRKALQDSKVNKKLGALIGMEVFMLMLGRLFEPFVVQLLPNLLVCYGDATTAVREVTEDTSKVLMRCLSATGVRITLPVLLKALDQDVWRTKVGSVQLLASMGNCAPKQLSICLPTIVPKIIEVLGDSHMKVQEAASLALKQLCKSIRNPEIAILSKQIIAALEDPANQTHNCLLSIAKLEFKHYIDAASLSLLMPILQRGFKERSSETKKWSALVIGALYLLTDQRDLSPYLASVIPGIKASILDPVPEVRAVTATVLGAMVRGSGEDVVVELMPWLMEKLTCDTSQVDRSGAAQAISEVVGALGLTKLDEFMEQIILTIDDPKLEPHIKDGYLMLFIYLPIVMGDDFSPYIGLIIGPVLNGLAEDIEYVRNTAMLAGERIVNLYADSAITLLLPELEKGVLEENWRIRFSSVKLIGDLLYKVSGVAARAHSDIGGEDFNDGKTEEAIETALGIETRNRVISAIYICRSDITQEVRHAALHIWKMIISNTPRTLREILPTLFNILLECLVSPNEDKQQTAARILGDLVKKLGERVLPEIVPILDDGLRSNRPDLRQGVCMALSEIILATSKDMVPTFVPSLIPTVRKALQDPLARVRKAAAGTFDSLYQVLGSRSLDEVLPPLIKQLNDPIRGEAALDAIKQMITVKSRVILPYILPHIADQQRVNTKALALIAPVASETLTDHLGKILPAMLLTLSRKLESKDEKKEAEYCNIILLSSSDHHGGTQIIVDQLLNSMKQKNMGLKKAGAILLNGFCHRAKLMPSQISLILRGLLMLYAEQDHQLLEQSWDAINCLTMNMDSAACVDYLLDIKAGIRYAIFEVQGPNAHKKDAPAVELPGFMSAKGFAPLVSVYRETIIHGPPDRKESAATSLCDIITHSSVQAVEANTMKIAGIVMRILSECIIKDRHSCNVKVALLDTLIMLMDKAGSKMRPFIPLCEQTLRKLLLDPYKVVLLKTADALERLIAISESMPLHRARLAPLALEVSKARQGIESSPAG